MIMSGNEAWNRNVLNADGADITLSGRLSQMVGPATVKARPQTVDSFTDGTSRRLVRAERRERRPGRSATRDCFVMRPPSSVTVTVYYGSSVYKRRLVGQKDTVETNGRADRRTRPIAVPSPLLRSVTKRVISGVIRSQF